MNPILRNTLAVIAGLFVGCVVNMSIILMSGSVISPPEGTDVSTMQGLKAAMPFFEPKHFLFPFLAHAIGTFVGATATALLGVNHKTKLAFIIGAFFLLGGIVNVCTLPSPSWFTLIDLAFAYLPMAYFAVKAVGKRKKMIAQTK